MSILSGTKTGLEGSRKRVEDWLHRMGITNYTLMNLSKEEKSEQSIWMIDIKDADVNLVGYKNESLPDYIQFNKITGGNFICSYSGLTTMKGFPKEIGMNFDISFSKISSLDEVPPKVNKDFVACGLSFTEEQIRATTEVTCKVYL